MSAFLKIFAKILLVFIASDPPFKITGFQDLSTVPTIGHLEGICHSYVDKDANPKIAQNVVYNAKLRNTAICGATETILLHKQIIKKIGNSILKSLEESGCKIIGDSKIMKSYKGKIKRSNKYHP